MLPSILPATRIIAPSHRSDGSGEIKSRPSNRGLAEVDQAADACSSEKPIAPPCISMHPMPRTLSVCKPVHRLEASLGNALCTAKSLLGHRDESTRLSVHLQSLELSSLQLESRLHELPQQPVSLGHPLVQVALRLRMSTPSTSDSMQSSERTSYGSYLLAGHVGDRSDRFA